MNILLYTHDFYYFTFDLSVGIITNTNLQPVELDMSHYVEKVIDSLVNPVVVNTVTTNPSIVDILKYKTTPYVIHGKILGCVIVDPLMTLHSKGEYIYLIKGHFIHIPNMPINVPMPIRPDDLILIRGNDLVFTSLKTFSIRGHTVDLLNLDPKIIEFFNDILKKEKLNFTH